MVISDRDDFPAPVFGGKVLKRVGGNDESGIVFYNQMGNEQGALAWDGRQEKRSESNTVLSYDTASTDQLLQLDDGSRNGEQTAYLVGWNRPDAAAPEFQRFLQELSQARTRSERTKLVGRPSAKRFLGARRFFFGYDRTNTSRVTLDDGAGPPRIKMFVTADGSAKLQFLNAHGAVTSEFPGLR